MKLFIQHECFRHLQHVLDTSFQQNRSTELNYNINFYYQKKSELEFKKYML